MEEGVPDVPQKGSPLHFKIMMKIFDSFIHNPSINTADLIYVPNTLV
jgi:hypothetical protein